MNIYHQEAVINDHHDKRIEMAQRETHAVIVNFNETYGLS